VPEISGVLSALITPFSPKDGEIDESGLRDLVERTILAGVHGLVPCGSTGEFPAMTFAERCRVVEAVIDQAAGRVAVVPHTGAMTSREAVELSRHAEATGADGVLAVSPYYEPLTVGEIKDYFADIADAVTVPVMVYNLPVATGVNLVPEDIVDLARMCPNVKYVKDTTGNFSQAGRYIHDFSDEIKLFVGWDSMFFGGLVEGAAGAIMGSANFIAPQLMAVYIAIQEGRLADAKNAWNEIFGIAQFLMSGGYVTGVRGALDILGCSAGVARKPMEELPPERRAQLEALLKNLTP
jgi:4-hydroxy-tetrahydrodipicolinate synthase